MKKTHLIIAAAVVVGVLATASAQTNRAQASGSSFGRYQLLAGEHEVTGKTTSFDAKDIFRIDTATGTTSFYSVGYDKDGKVVSEWVPIK